MIMDFQFKFFNGVRLFSLSMLFLCICIIYNYF